jgi:hypothetical protein
MQHYMTRFFVLLPFVTLAVGCQNQTANEQSEQPPVVTTQQVQNVVVEASCGECQFGLAGNGCDLAVRIDGKAYFVDGSELNDHGDAHADDGFCNAVRQARVQGSIENGRFVATSFELLPSDDE